MSRHTPKPLTTRQRTVLMTLSGRGRMTTKRIGVRSDVLWRLEELGLVARNSHDQWIIRPAGEAAIGEEPGA